MNAPTVRLPLVEVMRRTGKSKTTIYAEIATGEFPKPVKDGRRSLWIDAEIEAYNQASIVRRDMGKNMGRNQAA